MRKFIVVLTIACAIWTVFAVSAYAAKVPAYAGVSHCLTDASVFGKRKETMTIKNKQKETIEIKATVRLYVKNKYSSGDYLNNYKLKAGKEKTISSKSEKNASYGKYSYYITSNSGDTWGDSDIDW